MTVSMGPSGTGLPTPDSATRSAGGWFIAGGVALAMLSLLLFASPAVGSASVTALIGVGLLLGGAAMVGVSILGREYASMWPGVIIGSLLLLAGFFLWSDLLRGTVTLTALVIIWLIVDGSVGLVVNVVRRDPGWGIAVLGSCVSLLLGLLLWADWPSTAEWVLGVYAGLVLLLRGLSMVATGLLLRQA
jgi:uncharacterized membrane protein HdeD (DUF308 family)